MLSYLGYLQDDIAAVYGELGRGQIVGYFKAGICLCRQGTDIPSISSHVFTGIARQVAFQCGSKVKAFVGLDTVQDRSGIVRSSGIDVGELFTYGVRGDLNGQGLYGIYAFGAQIESKVVYAVFVFVRCEAFVRSNEIFACGAALCGRGAEGNRQRIGTG